MVTRTNGSQLGRDMFSDEHMRQVVERRAVLMVDHISLQWRTAAYCRRTLKSSFHFSREHIDENPLSFLMSPTMSKGSASTHSTLGKQHEYHDTCSSLQLACIT
ncbi:hypothetical protein MRX96_038029 [Rhipicephalus microplus]